jgi:high frequency lysogenization protein
LNHTFDDQILALSGVFQAASLVYQIAHRGSCPDAAMEATLGSLFITNPENTLDVYGDLYGLREGLSIMGGVLDKQTSQKDVEILRYALNLIHLEGRLKKRQDMLDIVASRLDQARRGVDHFGILHTNVIANVASIYVDTISTFRLRIQVTGEPMYLRVEENAARIRALLMAGIRSAVLWRQLGGRRWQLVLRRRRVIDVSQDLRRQLD